MACDAKDCGFQVLNDDEIVTSAQESDSIDDETDEDEDNNNNESSKGLPKADVFSALETDMKWCEQQSEAVQLNYCGSRESETLQRKNEEYAIFGHKEDEKFTDFKAVKAEIAAQMPPKYKFSSVPIQVKIYSPRVLKLTLVDLPGLVRVVVDGQPESSILEVRDMVLSYIKQPESLILAVSPANQDLASSDAIEIARTVDPQKLRTIGVLTKLDIMDEGTDARDVLENRQVTLNRGWVGVLNRSQLDIDEGRDIQYILDREKRFFLEKACYRRSQRVPNSPTWSPMKPKWLPNCRPTWSLNMVPTWLYRQDFSKFSLSRHYSFWAKADAKLTLSTMIRGEVSLRELRNHSTFRGGTMGSTDRGLPITALR
ncbi:dynamin-2 [Trichonephila clavipes]|nr:dynamin-2 [Trichonephila clavipes]